MAILLAWISWLERAPDESIWQALRQRASVRSCFPGRELTGPGWRVHAAPGSGHEGDPVVTSDRLRVRVLDWHAYDATLLGRAAHEPLSEMRQTAPLAGLELHLSPEGRPVALELARDLLGRRNLVYAAIPGGLLVASGEHMLLAHPAVAADPDPDYLAAHLCLRAAPAHSTAFAQVRCVIAGQHLRIEARRTRDHCLQLQPDWRWRSMSDEQVASETVRLLDQATARCVHSVPRVGLSLSAGVDSLAVASALQRLKPQRPATLAVTYGFDHWPDIDERRLAGKAAQVLSLEWQAIAADQLMPLAAQLDRPICPDTPIASFYREIKEAVYARFARFGASLWLSGAFGDHLCAPPVEALTDALRYRRWGSCARLLFTVDGAAPASRLGLVKRLARHALGRMSSVPSLRTVTASASLRAQLNQRWQHELAGCAAFPRPRQALAVLDAYAMHAASGENWYAQRHGMHVADPFRDIDLTRWLLSLPADLQNHRQTKSLLRCTLSSELPLALRERPKSSNLTPFLLSAWQGTAAQHRRLSARGAEFASHHVAGIDFTLGKKGTSEADRCLTEFLLAGLILWWEKAQNDR